MPGIIYIQFWFQSDTVKVLNISLAVSADDASINEAFAFLSAVIMSEFSVAAYHFSHGLFITGRGYVLSCSSAVFFISF